MNRNNAPANNPTRFGTRISRTHPEFEIGDAVFDTRLITVAEDRALTRQQAKLPKGEVDPETGLPGDLTPEQQDETVQIMSEIVSKLLQSRLKSGVEPDAITADWVADNMISNDFGPLMYFLRVGEPQTEDLDLDAIGDDSGGDPNADLLLTTTG